LTNAQNKWIKKERKNLVEEFGGSCQECGSTKKLEFAHIKPTNLSGWGRGRKERYYDVKNNKDCYKLLCKKCHKELDKK
jgi:5-methylcytosine-specific restriction endonuclease McrA